MRTSICTPNFGAASICTYRRRVFRNLSKAMRPNTLPFSLWMSRARRPACTRNSRSRAYRSWAMAWISRAWSCTFRKPRSRQTGSQSTVISGFRVRISSLAASGAASTFTRSFRPMFGSVRSASVGIRRPAPADAAGPTDTPMPDHAPFLSDVVDERHLQNPGADGQGRLQDVLPLLQLDQRFGHVHVADGGTELLEGHQLVLDALFHQFETVRAGADFRPDAVDAVRQRGDSLHVGQQFVVVVVLQMDENLVEDAERVVGGPGFAEHALPADADRHGHVRADVQVEDAAVRSVV